MNEKMQILKMLEDGKISAEQAARLLEAANPGTVPAPDRKKPALDKQQYSQRTSEAPRTETSYSNSNGRQKTASGSGSFDNFTDELGKKFEAFRKDFEPKLQKFTAAVAEKTATAADKISKTMSEAGQSGGGAPKRAAAPGFSSGTTKNIEMHVTSGDNELNLSAFCAPLMIKGYNGDKISVKLMYKAKVSGARIELVTLGSKYFLDYNADEFSMVAVDAFVPEYMFYSIKASVDNGELSLSSINAEYVDLYNSNCNVTASGITCKYLKIESGNSREMRLASVAAEKAIIENFNGNIVCDGVDVENLKLATFNGLITMNVAAFSKYSDYSWMVETANNRLQLNLPTAPGLGYHICASTTLGNVRLGLTGMNFLINTKNRTEAKSINYDSAAKKVNMSLETSNGDLILN